MEKIEKSFSGVRVLHGVSFELKEGEIHVLAGENGAGKTTLIKILSGVHTDYQGFIRFKGELVRFKSPQEAAKKGIVAIHQELSLVNSMSVLDNIFLGREITRPSGFIDYRAERIKARPILECLGLEVDLSQPVEHYPYSVRQMVEIAKTLVNDAQVIVMDEPSSALSEFEVRKLFKIISDLKKRGCSLIYITHRLEEVYRISDRITVLRDGQHVGTALTRDLHPEKLIHWMVGREISRQFPEYIHCHGEERLRVGSLFVPDPMGMKRWVVENISFSLRQGEILGFAGLQGSGKSELFHGLFGSFGRGVRGKIFLDGKPVVVRSPSDSIREGIVLLTNDRKGTGLIPPLNVVHNITLASLRRFSPRGWVQTQRENEHSKKYVQRLQIKINSLDQEVQTLSGGNQQKVVLAKWLETNPRVLLLDEPTLGVDVGAKHDIYCLMNEWKSQGISMCLITSELPELLAMADRILVMHRGRKKAEFARAEATQEKLMKAAVGGEA
ncbi:MAG: sugar ABC transporter ATP-binding protein [Candidatus Aminicenantales bacterium]